ncbi:MAG: hypothetical protein PHF86_02260 [Candidatus Nanoarchaeia archaeon]|nr:hypothetical protein [Candidatus Nanoarchaeia archaeon]
MKLVKESLKFERGQDPMDALNIGDPRIREIHKNYQNIKSIIETGVAEELMFGEFRHKIDKLKEIMDYVVINHIRNKFKIDAKFETESNKFGSGSNLFAIAYIGPYKYEFRKNGVGSTYWTEIKGLNLPESPEKKAYLKLTSQSTSLKSFDSKLSNLLKKYY